MTWSMPTSAATDLAAPSLSPVSRIGVSPSSLSPRIASAEVSLTVSRTVIIPESTPSIVTTTGFRRFLGVLEGVEEGVDKRA